MDQLEMLMEYSDDPGKLKDWKNEPCEEGTVSLTDSNKYGDLNSQENNQVPSQARPSQGQTSQEGSLLDQNSDVLQNGDTQSSEIEMSFCSTRMKSTLQTEKQKSLDNWEELSQAIGEFPINVPVFSSHERIYGNQKV